MCVIGKKGSKATALKEPKSCNGSSHLRASVPFRDPLVAQMVKNLPVMQETQVRSLGQGRSPGEQLPIPVFLPAESYSLE